MTLHLHLNCDEEFIVEANKEGKGEEDHSKEIGDEDVIPENIFFEDPGNLSSSSVHCILM